MILNLLLRLTIWFLLTADLSWPNLVLGVAIALLLPRTKRHRLEACATRERLKDWLRILAEIFVAIPQAYFEAFEMIFRPHKREEITRERVKPGRSRWLIFLDIFLITFTPKTIVLKYYQQGWYEVHRIREGQEQ